MRVPKRRRGDPLTPQLELTPVARRRDRATSQEAGAHIGENLTTLQFRVLEALTRHGSMSGRQLERLPELVDMAPSSARKRCTDLMRMGKILPCGVERDSGPTAATVWAVVG